MLKNFIAEAELSQNRAERFLVYVERYHPEVMQDLKTRLTDSWEKVIKKLEKSVKIDPEATKLALLKNEKAVTALTVSTRAEKVTSPRHPKPIEVSPSVKIPSTLATEQRDLVIRELYDSAEEAIKKLVDGWGEIFNVEKTGRVKPWFKILRTEDEVKLQLVISLAGSETYKTIYVIRTDYRRSASKLNNFDRVYCTSLI